MPFNTGLLQGSYVYTLDTIQYTNQVHYRQIETDFNPTSLADHAAQHGAALLEKWQDNLEPLLVSGVSLQEIQLTYYDVVALYPPIPPSPVGTPQTLQFRAQEEAVVVTGMPSAGDVVGDFLPSFNALRARKISAVPGRRGRGHNSFSGIPEADTIGNILQTGDWTTWSTNAPAMLGTNYAFTVGTTTYTMVPVVASITSARIVNMPGTAASLYGFPIISVIPNRLIGTMRRRKKKVV